MCTQAIALKTHAQIYKTSKKTAHGKSGCTRDRILEICSNLREDMRRDACIRACWNSSCDEYTCRKVALHAQIAWTYAADNNNVLVCLHDMHVYSSVQVFVHVGHVWYMCLLLVETPGICFCICMNIWKYKSRWMRTLKGQRTQAQTKICPVRYKKDKTRIIELRHTTYECTLNNTDTCMLAYVFMHMVCMLWHTYTKTYTFFISKRKKTNIHAETCTMYMDVCPYEYTWGTWLYEQILKQVSYTGANKNK